MQKYLINHGTTSKPLETIETQNKIILYLLFIFALYWVNSAISSLFSPVHIDDDKYQNEESSFLDIESSDRTTTMKKDDLDKQCTIFNLLLSMANSKIKKLEIENS